MAACCSVVKFIFANVSRGNQPMNINRRSMHSRLDEDYYTLK